MPSLDRELRAIAERGSDDTVAPDGLLPSVIAGAARRRARALVGTSLAGARRRRARRDRGALARPPSRARRAARLRPRPRHPALRPSAVGDAGKPQPPGRGLRRPRSDAGDERGRARVAAACGNGRGRRPRTLLDPADDAPQHRGRYPSRGRVVHRLRHRARWRGGGVGARKRQARGRRTLDIPVLGLRLRERDRGLLLRRELGLPRVRRRGSTRRRAPTSSTPWCTSRRLRRTPRGSGCCSRATPCRRTTRRISRSSPPGHGTAEARPGPSTARAEGPLSGGGGHPRCVRRTVSRA